MLNGTYGGVRGEAGDGFTYSITILLKSGAIIPYARPPICDRIVDSVAFTSLDLVR